MIYANDNDKSAAHWLSCLPLGLDTIDSRSIADVKGSDLVGFTQCHFFAGIGGWPYALQLAGWPADAPVWTGSCPCQPFSCAGKGKGTADDRHLWPEFRRLIDECRPAVVFGEQVASKAGRNWLAIVRADLEALGYGVGAADLSAAGAGAPHIRQRLFWVAYRSGAGLEERTEQSARQEHQAAQRGGDAVCGMADSAGSSGPEHEREPGRGPRRKAGPENPAIHRCDSRGKGDTASTGSLPIALGGVHRGEEGGGPWNGEPQRSSDPDERLGDTESDGWQQGRSKSNGRDIATTDSRMGHAASLGSNGRLRCEPNQSTGDGRGLFAGSDHWSDIEFIPCRDGKARPVKPGLRLLAHGVSGRVAQLRGLGNAIVPQVAAIFIASFIDAITHRTVEA